MGKYGSIKLFRLFGIQLELHVTFLLLVAWVAWSSWMDGGGAIAPVIWSTAFVLLIFTCVVLHELGHCLMARRYKIPIYRILLLPIGGMAQFGHIPRKPLRELFITLAGPMVNFLIAGILRIFLGSPWVWFNADFQYSWIDLLFSLMIFNFAMGLFNLLPIFPMDGGRILRAILALKYSYLAATRAAVYVAMPLAAGGVLLALVYENVSDVMALLFAFIFVGGQLEYKMVKRSELLRGWTVGSLASKNFLSLPGDTTVGNTIEVLGARAIQLEAIFLQDRGGLNFISPQRLQNIVARIPPDDPLLPFTKPMPAYLDADWPLQFLSGRLEKEGPSIYPVLRKGVLVGVLNSNNLPTGFFDK